MGLARPVSFADTRNATAIGPSAPSAWWNGSIGSPSTPNAGSQSVTQFGAASAGWLEGLRQSVDTDVKFQTTLVTRASDALSNATGVNLDDEYALQLQLEQSYAASSKLIGVVNDLFNTLMQAV